jgi:hypothetical protein
MDGTHQRSRQFDSPANTVRPEEKFTFDSIRNCCKFQQFSMNFLTIGGGIDANKNFHLG